MCRQRFAAQTAEEVEVQAMELAQKHAEEEVAAFECEGEVAQETMQAVMEEAAAVAADIAIGKMLAAVARKAVAMEAAMAALRVMHKDTAMVSLEAVAKEATKVAVHELCDGVVAREAEAEAHMYINDAMAEESRIATACCGGSWEDLRAVARRRRQDRGGGRRRRRRVEAERNAELRATDTGIREAATQRDVGMEARAWQERYEHHRVEDLAELRVKVKAAHGGGRGRARRRDGDTARCRSGGGGARGSRAGRPLGGQDGQGPHPPEGC
jgi:uncharacterized membrane protein YgcG